MNNMYDILDKMKLLEGRGSKPDFLDLDKDGDRKESMKKAAKEKKVDEAVEEVAEGDVNEAASKTARMARIAKLCARDAFSNIDRKMFLKAAEYFAAGDEERGLDAIRRMDTEASDDFYMGCDEAGIPVPMDESALQAYLGKKKYGEKGMKALQQAGREGASKEKMARIRAKHDKMDEAEMDEGNDFTGARLAAIKAGKPTFSVGGKTYKVTGDTSDEKVMEKKGKTLWPGTPEYKAKFGDEMRTGEKKRSSTGGEIEKTATGVRHTKSYDDEEGEDKKVDDGAPKKRGRPKGSKRALGAKGPTGRSKLLTKEGELEEDQDQLVDRGEYDREGDMAKEQLHTIESAAKELHDLLSDDQNLPEWVQSKITKAMDYIDTARDYMISQDAEEQEQEVMPERALTKPEMTKREKYVKSMKKSKGDFEKRYGDRGEEVMYATATKMAKKKAEESKDEEDKVEETTTSGSVATAPAEAPKGKKGMIFGKGVYEGLDAKYNQLLNEGMSMNMSVGEDGKKSLNVNATDDDAVKLAQILKLAGMEQAHGHEEACPTCGQSPCGCESLEEGDYANSPEETGADINTLVNTYSDGLNGQKTTGQTTIPVIAGQTQRMMSQVSEQAEQRLWDLYKRYDK